MALEDEMSQSLTVYVSWNWDTETRSWRFWRKHALGEKIKRGFETKLQVKSNVKLAGYFAEAVGEKNRVLGKTEVAAKIMHVLQYVLWKAGSAMGGELQKGLG